MSDQKGVSDTARQNVSSIRRISRGRCGRKATASRRSGGRRLQAIAIRFASLNVKGIGTPKGVVYVKTLRRSHQRASDLDHEIQNHVFGSAVAGSRSLSSFPTIRAAKTLNCLALPRASQAA